jgi:hypothetical protein
MGDGGDDGLTGAEAVCAVDNDVLAGFDSAL